MMKNTIIYNSTPKYKYFLGIGIIIILSVVSFYVLSNTETLNKPLIHILDLRKDQISTKLIDELKSKGICGQLISNYSEIKKLFINNRTKLVLVICEMDINSQINFSTEIFDNNLENISHDALVTVTKETIRNFAKRYRLSEEIFLSKYFII